MFDTYIFAKALKRFTDTKGNVYKDDQRDALYRYVQKFHPTADHWNRVIDHLIDTWEMARLPSAAHFRQALQATMGNDAGKLPKTPCARCDAKGTLLYYEIRHGEVWDETVCGCGCNNTPPGITMNQIINAGRAPYNERQFARFNGRGFDGEPGQVRYRLENLLQQGEPAPDETPAGCPF